MRAAKTQNRSGNSFSIFQPTAPVRVFSTPTQTEQFANCARATLFPSYTCHRRITLICAVSCAQTDAPFRLVCVSADLITHLQAQRFHVTLFYIYRGRCKLLTRAQDHYFVIIFMAIVNHSTAVGRPPTDAKWIILHSSTEAQRRFTLGRGATVAWCCAARQQYSTHCEPVVMADGRASAAGLMETFIGAKNDFGREKLWWLQKKRQQISIHCYLVIFLSVSVDSLNIIICLVLSTLH